MESNELLEILAAAEVRKIALAIWRQKIGKASEAEASAMSAEGITEPQIRAAHKELIRIARVVRESPSSTGEPGTP